MNGSTDREGRVEVCMDGKRWRTVCTGNQDLAVLARAVCIRIGIDNLVLEGDDHIIAIYLYQIAQLYRKHCGSN